MSKCNLTLDKQLHCGLCGASELVRKIASVIGIPWFDGKSPTGYQQPLKQSAGKDLAHFREQINRYDKDRHQNEAGSKSYIAAKPKLCSY